MVFSRKGQDLKSRNPTMNVRKDETGGSKKIEIERQNNKRELVTAYSI